MRSPIFEAIPDIKTLLSLSPEELAGVLLPILVNREGASGSRHFSINNLLNEVFNDGPAATPDEQRSTLRALAEAVAWMKSFGLVCEEPQQRGEWQFLTRLAKSAAETGSFSRFLQSKLLSRDFLHALIADKAWPSFLRGEYDSAVFLAFKEVEISVRSASGFDARVVGTDLMRTAFHPETGPLSDMSLPKAERESLAHLFAGAIGSYKNPTSHRTVTISDPSEAGEMLVLASHLVRIVDDRRKRLLAK